MDDSEIVAAIAAGDPAGLAAACDRYATGVYGYCRWMLRDRTAAADALVAAFAAAAPRLGGLTDASATRACLYAAARAECHRLGRPSAPTADPDPNADPGPHPDPDGEQGEIDRRRTRRGRHRQLAPPPRPADQNASPAPAQLAVLPSQEHEAIELTSRHGLSEAELAAVLQLSLGEARALAERARERVPPSHPRWDAIPAELRARLLRDAAAGLGRSSDGGLARPARPAAVACRRLLGRLATRTGVSANPGVATAVAGVAAWTGAAIAATLITLTGSHSGRDLSGHGHAHGPASYSPPAGGSIAPTTKPGRSRSPGPSTSPAHRAPVPSTTSPGRRRSPSPSVTPSPSPSSTPSPSPSSTPSPTGSPSVSASPTP